MNWTALFLSIAIVLLVVLIFGRGEYDPEVDYRWERTKMKIKRKLFGDGSNHHRGGYPF